MADPEVTPDKDTYIPPTGEVLLLKAVLAPTLGGLATIVALEAAQGVVPLLTEALEDPDAELVH